MYGQDINSKNKALIYGIVAIWGIVGYRTTKDYFYSGNEHEWLYQIGLILAWVLWIFGMVYIYRTLKIVFKK